MKRPLIVLTGPTAVGKTSLSISLAKAVNGEIISADSMKHISAALQMESMIPEQMRKENIRRIGINSVLFLSIHYPVKWVVSGAVSFDVLSIISSI